MAVPPDLQQGLAAHKSGRLDEAERLYRKAARIPAARGDALHLLGLLALERGKLAEARAALAKAVSHTPALPAYRLSKARAEYMAGDHSAALSTLTAIQPAAIPDATQRQHLAEALTAIATALLKARGPDAALPAFRRATAFQPNHPGMARNLGLALSATGAAAEAVAPLASALAAAPDDPELHLAHAEALLESGDFDAAEAASRDAMGRFPADARFRSMLAACLMEMDRIEEALPFSESALASSGATAARLFNHANLLYGVGRVEDAIAAYNSAEKAGFAGPALHTNRAKARLTQAPVSADGWAEYGLRAIPPLPKGAPPPIRAASELPDAPASICLLAEQGLGDQLFFLRWAPLLLARGHRLALAIDAKLAPILRHHADFTWFDEPRAAARAGFTRSIWLGDLPALLAGSDGTAAVPPPLPVMLDPAGRDAAREALCAAAGCDRLIGWTWRAGQVGRSLLSKAAPFDSLLDILADTGAGVVGLQRHPTPEELERCAARLGRRFVDRSADNAALGAMATTLSALDGYVTVSNTNLHIAESLGHIPSHVLIPRPYFTWGAEGSSSVWFPNSRCLRPDPEHGWEPALATLAAAL